MVIAAVSGGTVIGVIASAFITGALARLAIPGPDPMPIWLTILIGLVGTFGGGGLAYLAGLRSPYAVSTIGFVTAILLVVAYRRFVQRRPIFGQGAYQFPKRGFGIETYRNRLRKAGLDPDNMPTVSPLTPLTGQPAAASRATTAGAAEDPLENPAHFIGRLDELHDAGVLSDDEYQAARLRLLERLRS
ncbi:MAG TPA: SHOCT domain-containing protein [Gaiellaceae bacterium]|nr:SHOCT domain-containing protein [Gaiellaceae bacterium]